MEHTIDCVCSKILNHGLSGDLKSENNNPWFKPWFNSLLHTQSIVCARVDSV